MKRQDLGALALAIGAGFCAWTATASSADGARVSAVWAREDEYWAAPR